MEGGERGGVVSWELGLFIFSLFIVIIIEGSKNMENAV
jgi:hypothetical protein